MSLINEALKRAEQNKNRTAGSADTAPPLPPISETRPTVVARTGNTDRNSQRLGIRRERSQVTRMIVIAGLILAAFVGWMVYTTGPKSLPQSAAADVETAGRGVNQIAGPPTDSSLAFAGSHRQTMSAPTTSPATTPASRPAAAVAAAVPIAPAAPSAPSAIEAVPTPAVQSPSASGESLPCAEPTTAPAVATPPTPSIVAPIAPLTAAPTTQPAEPKFNEADYKLSGVTRGPDGATAIINDEALSEGQTIKDALVVKILRNSVTLRVGQREFTIRM